MTPALPVTSELTLIAGNQWLLLSHGFARGSVRIVTNVCLGVEEIQVTRKHKCYYRSYSPLIVSGLGLPTIRSPILTNTHRLHNTLEVQVIISIQDRCDKPCEILRTANITCDLDSHSFAASVMIWPHKQKAQSAEIYRHIAINLHLRPQSHRLANASE